MKPPKAPLNISPTKTISYKHHTTTSSMTYSNGFSPQRLSMTISPSAPVKESVFMECHSNLLKNDEALRLITKGLGNRRF
jgi:hypothetical protein